MDALIVIGILVFVFGLAILPIIIFRAFRKNKPVKSKEERRAESIAAIIFILFLTFVAVIRETSFNNRRDEILEESNSIQSNE